MELDVGLAPKLLTETRFEEALCAVVDVLRATTTIVVALASGVVEVCPCMDAAEARQRADSLSHRPYLLCGEEKGRRIPGFHLGNSPLEYLVPDVVAGKTIFLSTTNGTPVMRKAHSYSGFPVYLIALLNVSAVSSAIVRTAVNGSFARIFLLCSGRYSGLSPEDLFCAGLVVQKVREGLLQAGITSQLGDGASIARGSAAGNDGRAFEVLTESEHGRYLQSIGFAADLEFACQMDVYDIVPAFDGERVTLQQEKG